MERDGSRLYLPALFHEALGKEYSVFSDKRGRSHNVARLAIATFIKGYSYGGTGGPATAYRPTWAPDLRVQVITHLESAGAAFLDEVILEGNSREPLLIRYEEFTVPNLRIGGGSLDRPQIMALDIDEGMDQARELVVTQAQSMIDHTS